MTEYLLSERSTMESVVQYKAITPDGMIAPPITETAAYRVYLSDYFKETLGRGYHVLEYESTGYGYAKCSVGFFLWYPYFLVSDNYFGMDLIIIDGSYLRGINSK